MSETLDEYLDDMERSEDAQPFGDEDCEEQGLSDEAGPEDLEDA